MSNRHPTPWRMEVFDNKRRGLYHQHWASVIDGRGEFIVEGLDEATAKEIVENANRNEQIAEVKAVLERMKQKEDAFWTCKQPRIGTFAAALMLDGFRTAIAIAIGEYPRPKGGA